MPPYISPTAEILRAREDGPISRLDVRFDRMDIGPVAPAGLYVDPNSGQESFQLHKVVGQDGLVFHFETYHSTHSLPSVGRLFAYRGWWTQDAMNAVLDTNAKWEHRTYPDDGTHEHCLITCEAIGSEYARAGWWSSAHGWIAEAAHRQFIVEDIYRLRTDSVVHR